MTSEDVGGEGISTPFNDPPEFGKAIEIADNILWFRLPLPMALDHVNVYALRDPDGWTVIDTGFASNKNRDIWNSILDGPLADSPLNRVLVTHHHPDHIGLAGWLRETRGAEIWTTRTAWLFARMLTLDEQEVPAPETLAYWRAAGMSGKAYDDRAAARPFNFADIVHPIPLGFTKIAAEDRLEIGGRSWKARLGHGHAPDHLVLFSDDEEFVIAGDHYLRTISPNLGVYATEPEANPVRDWIESHEALLPHLTSNQLALPGHGLPFTGLPFRAVQQIENHVSALDRLEAFVATPHTAVECFLTLFKREIGQAEYTLALVEAMAHCLALWHAGRATREIREDGAWVFSRKEMHDA